MTTSAITSNTTPAITHSSWDFQTQGGLAKPEPTNLLETPHRQHVDFPPGDLGARLAALVRNSAKNQEEISRAIEEAAHASQKRAEDAELSAMKRSSGMALVQSLVGAAGQAGSGVIGLHGTAKGASAAATQSWQKLSEASGTAGAGCAGIGKDAADRAAKAESFNARTAERASERARKDAEGAEKLMDEAVAFYKEYVATRNETVRVLLQRA